jgi:uncharacterized protein
MQRGYLHIPVQHLTDEPFCLQVECPVEKIGLDGFIGNVVVDASIRHINQRLQLICTARATADAFCDRCAEEFRAEYTTTFEQWYMFDSHAENKDEDDEAIVISPDLRDVVIDDEVRESMLIALPMKRLCREDCLGLCPQCGRNRNIEPCDCGSLEDNPLWAGLKNVKN